MNRHDRRQAKTIVKTLDPVPNFSGDERACLNCKYACPQDRQALIAIKMAPWQIAENGPQINILPESEIICQRFPDSRVKKIWAFCWEWKPTPAPKTEETVFMKKTADTYDLTKHTASCLIWISGLGLTPECDCGAMDLL